MKIYITYKETVENENYDPGDGGPYDHSWSCTSSFEALGAFLTQPDHFDYELFDLDFNVEVGDELHILTVIYSDGDTFGNSCGNGEIFWVFKTIEKAKQTEALIWNNRKSFSISFDTESGKKVSLSNPGVGYFETLDEIRLKSFSLQP